MNKTVLLINEEKQLFISSPVMDQKKRKGSRWFSQLVFWVNSVLWWWCLGDKRSYSQ